MAEFQSVGITAAARTPVAAVGGGASGAANHAGPGFLQAFGDGSQPLDLQSQSAVVLMTSLAFFVPALSAWRASWNWHAWLFATLAMLSTAYHICETDLLSGFGMDDVTCSPAAEHVLTHAYQMWVCFCFLQMAFLILGPEDPQLHLGEKAASQGSRSVREAPADVIVIARLAPLALLALFHLSASVHADHHETQWKGVLLTELLLVFGCIGFWLPRQRRASDVLLRFKYWHRLLQQGGLPVMMRLWICCIVAFPDCRALHCMWQIVVASFSVAMLRAVLPEAAGPRSTLINVYDTSALNPTISHVLLCGPALAALPASFIGASYDWCNESGWRISTLQKATTCQPGGYFLAIVAVPVFATVAVAFYLIDAASGAKLPWTEFTRPLEAGDPRLDHRHRILGKHLGCTLGTCSGGLGLAAALIMRASSLETLLSTLLGAAALLGLISAMVITVLCSDPASRGCEFRQRFTLFVCLPFLAFHGMLLLMERCITTWVAVPRAVFALSEQITVLVFVLWPMTWATVLNEDAQRKQITAFTWPRTAWRFDAGLNLPHRPLKQEDAKAAFATIVS